MPFFSSYLLSWLPANKQVAQLTSDPGFSQPLLKAWGTKRLRWSFGIKHNLEKQDSMRVSISSKGEKTNSQVGASKTVFSRSRLGGGE